jgi:hypothetical protein
MNLMVQIVNEGDRCEYSIQDLSLLSQRWQWKDQLGENPLIQKITGGPFAHFVNLS